MKWIVVTVLVLGMATVVYVRVNPQTLSVISPVGVGGIVEKPLTKYSIEQLSTRKFTAGSITLGEISSTSDSFIVRPFSYMSDGKKVSGVAHIPKGSGPFPVIVQFRGYVDPILYTPGMGILRSAEVFAKNGFISLAPDFLGYGGSDPLSNNIFLDRFETYTSAINLIKSVGSFPDVDASRIGIWGHSNGGQIAITVAEILHWTSPMVLWAPVTKPFPYSILYYTDDADDHGKFLRKKLSEFETEYDAECYSLTNFLSRLAGPMQLHQGTEDDAVPQKWSDIFAEELKKQGKDIRYYNYPGADHNMLGSWNTVINRDVEFFKTHLK